MKDLMSIIKRLSDGHCAAKMMVEETEFKKKSGKYTVINNLDKWKIFNFKSLCLIGLHTHTKHT